MIPVDPIASIRNPAAIPVTAPMYLPQKNERHRTVQIIKSGTAPNKRYLENRET
jgi:hypothetical protein